MSRIVWDAPGERRYEIGVDRGVFYRLIGGVYTDGVAWNGLTGVDDDPGGREASPLYSGGVKVGSENTAEEYSGTIRCYTYPDEFEEYLGEYEIAPGIFGKQQGRELFGFSYRTLIGNDTDGTGHGYKIHLIYNMRVTDFSRSFATVNDTNDIQETQIPFETFPQAISDEDLELDPMSEIVVDSRFTDPDILAEIEDILYGGEETEARLPFPDEIIEMTTVREEMPEEWDLYPNVLAYPSDELSPHEDETEGGE